MGVPAITEPEVPEAVKKPFKSPSRRNTSFLPGAAERIRPLASLCWVSILLIGSGLAQSSGSDLSWIPPRVDREFPSLFELYRHLHANPEIAFQEARTAQRMAQELEASGFEVSRSIGGHGVVGLLRNGEGPTLMLRTDMDGLPITEETGLKYASEVRIQDPDGQSIGLMHACGHDVHMTCFVGAARILSREKKRWKGTLLMVAQPAEERGAGAKAMLAEGLFETISGPRLRHRAPQRRRHAGGPGGGLQRLCACRVSIPSI